MIVAGAPQGSSRELRKFGTKKPPEAHGVRSACDSGWRTTVTRGHLRSSDGCGHESAR